MAILGAHMSIAGGLHKSIARGEALGCEVIEIYTQPSRSWRIPPLSPREIENFREAMRSASQVRTVLAHSSKMVNLAHPRMMERKRAIRYFIEIMKRCEELQVEYLVTNLGSHLGSGIENGIKNAARSLNEILKSTIGFRTKIVIENSAGEGDSIGFKFEHIGAVLEQMNDSSRVSVCLDLQHAFAAGYEIRSPEAYDKTIQELASHVSLNKVSVIHLKDAHDALGSHSTQGEVLGKGLLGKETFRVVLNDPRFRATPMCLETDPGIAEEEFARDFKTLRSLVQSATG